MEKRFAEGTSQTATKWITSSLQDMVDQQNWLRFLERFPGSLYYRFTSREAVNAGMPASINTPPWLCDMFTVFTWISRIPTVARFHHISDDHHWYKITPGFIDTSCMQQVSFWAEYHLLPVAICLDDPTGVLVVKGENENDRGVYRMNREALLDSHRKKLPVKDCMQPLFERWTDLYGAIIELRQEYKNRIY